MGTNSLDNLAALNTRYSESQKEAQGVRNQLQTRDSTIADLQRQLTNFTQQQQAAQVAEQQRRAQEQQQAQQRAQQASEAQRLAALQAEAARNTGPAHYNLNLLTPEMRTAMRPIFARWKAEGKNVPSGIENWNDNNFLSYMKDRKWVPRRANDGSQIIWDEQGGPTGWWGDDYLKLSKEMRYENGRWQ